MTTLETLAANLAIDALAAMDETGNDRLYLEIGGVLASASQSLEEAFLTEVRIRLADRNARGFLDRKLAEARKAKPLPSAGRQPVP